MEYIKVFRNHSDYEDFTSGDTMMRPNVAHCIQENEVHYNASIDYSKEYLTFDILSNGTITWKTSLSKVSSTTISYSINNGQWTNITSSRYGETFNVSAGDKVRFKGNNSAYGIKSGASVYGTTFSGTASFNIEGNIMSLLYGDDFIDKITFESDCVFPFLFANTNVVSAHNLILPAVTMSHSAYANMFQGCTRLTTAPELPATTLAGSCYSSMFYGCTSLTTAPELPATTLADSCYNGMFRSCTSLTTAPVLSATTLASSCYSNMFYGCTSLTTAPALPATTLSGACYAYMFQGCTGLTTAPELPATTLDGNCYRYMFSGCRNLNYIKCLATDISANGSTSNWVSDVSSSGIFVKNANMSSWTTGVDGIPTGWTVQTATE